VGNNNQTNQNNASVQSGNNGTSVISDGKTKSRLLSVPPGDKDPIKVRRVFPKLKTTVVDS